MGVEHEVSELVDGWMDGWMDRHNGTESARIIECTKNVGCCYCYCCCCYYNYNCHH